MEQAIHRVFCVIRPVVSTAGGSTWELLLRNSPMRGQGAALQPFRVPIVTFFGGMIGTVEVLSGAVRKPSGTQGGACLSEEEWMQNKTSHPTASLGFGIHRAESESKETVRKARILVVDNDHESCRFLNARLSGGRYRVDTVDNSQAALDACVRSRPNLVISELRLKPMDGLALLKELKSRWPALTVIIVTAHATIAEAVRATQCGAFGFLVKPIEREELLGQVERALAASTFTLAEGDWRSEIVTRSQIMEERLGLANRAAGSDAPDSGRPHRAGGRRGFHPATAYRGQYREGRRQCAGARRRAKKRDGYSGRASGLGARPDPIRAASAPPGQAAGRPVAEALPGTQTRLMRSLVMELGAPSREHVFQHRGWTQPINCLKILCCHADLPLGRGPDRRRLGPYPPGR